MEIKLGKHTGWGRLPALCGDELNGGGPAGGLQYEGAPWTETLLSCCRCGLLYQLENVCQINFLN